MQHVANFKDAKWFKLETREEAEADHAQTGYKGALPFWDFAERGNDFYILRDAEDTTLMTTLVFVRAKVAQSKVNAGTEPDYHRDALEALTTVIGNDITRLPVMGEAPGSADRKSIDDEFVNLSEETPAPGR